MWVRSSATLEGVSDLLGTQVTNRGEAMAPASR